MLFLGCGFASQTQEIVDAGIHAGPAVPANGIHAGTFGTLSLIQRIFLSFFLVSRACPV
jgi:hypothetical protein